MKTWIVAFALLMVFAVGCARQAPVQETVTPEATAMDVSEFESDLSELDSLNEELDTSELDSLDQDLAALG